MQSFNQHVDDTINRLEEISADPYPIGVSENRASLAAVQMVRAALPFVRARHIPGSLADQLAELLDDRMAILATCERRERELALDEIEKETKS